MLIIKRYIGISNAISQILRTFSKFSLTTYQANVFDPQHLEGASLDLVQSMFQVGQKSSRVGARVKLQTENTKRKERTSTKEVRKPIEDGRKSRRSKRTSEKSQGKRKPKEEQEDDDFLDDLVVETGPGEMT